MKEVKEVIKEFIITTLKNGEAHPQDKAIVPELTKILLEMLQRIIDTLERIERTLSQTEREVGIEDMHHPDYRSCA